MNEPPAGSRSPSVPSTNERMVLLARRRWAFYLLPTTVIAAVVGIADTVETGEFRFLIGPALPAMLWVFLLKMTPREGMPDRRFFSEPTNVDLSVLFVVAFGLLLVTGIADSVINGRPFHAPLETYHLAVYGPFMLILAAGILIVDKRNRRRRKAKIDTHC